jgi:hypothetical protein
VKSNGLHFVAVDLSGAAFLFLAEAISASRALKALRPFTNAVLTSFIALCWGEIKGRVKETHHWSAM